MNWIRNSTGCRDRLARMLAAVFVMLTASGSLAQQAAPAQAITAGEAQELKVDAPDKKLFFSTTRIETRSADGKGTGVGTGFIFNYDPGDHKNLQFVVTCRQVVEGFASATLSFIQRKDGKPSLGEGCQVTVPNLQGMVFYDPDPKIDVALISLRQLLQRSYTNSEVPYFQMLSGDMVLNREQAGKLNAIQPVIFLGYPNGLSDETNLLPIARRGITASPYVVDFDGMPVCVINADVAPGSSGSPVVVLDQEANLTPTGVKAAGGVHFLGLLSTDYYQTRMTKFRPPPVMASGTNEQRSGDMGVVIKPEAIFFTITEYLKVHPTVFPDDSQQKN